jgi:hypothetical protein
MLRARIHVRAEDLNLGAEVAFSGLLQQQHGDGIGLLAGGAARDPDSHLGLGVAPEEMGNDIGGQGLEGLGIAEEAGDRDQQIGQQRLRLFRILPQIEEIALEILLARDLHAPQQPAHHRRALVMGEIMPGAHPQMCEYAAHIVFLVGAAAGNRSQALGPGQLDKSLGQLAERQHEIHHIGFDGGIGHGGMFGFRRVLHQDDAAGFLHRLDADGAVGAPAGQDDGEAVAMLGRQRAEKSVDRHALAARLQEGHGLDFLVADLKLPVGRMT